MEWVDIPSLLLGVLIGLGIPAVLSIFVRRG